MTPQNIKTMIESVGIPYAYHQFADDTGQQPPFICFFYGNSNDLAADNTNYARIEPLYIALEKQIETLLNANELVFRKEQIYLDSERMHETIYTTEVILEV